MSFQSTLPREERRSDPVTPSMRSNFNPRSHERSDDSCPIKAQIPSISIHAPTRGATRNTTDTLLMNTISIHAPTRGATMEIYNDLAAGYISIHAPTRGATKRRELYHEGGRISIHAPTRGATSGIALKYKLQSIFQSTLPREERRSVRHFGGILSLFQSTLPREERLYSLQSYRLIRGDFNPRSHERSDTKYDYLHPKTEISIHAPTRGATDG